MPISKLPAGSRQYLRSFDLAAIAITAKGSRIIVTKNPAGCRAAFWTTGGKLGGRACAWVRKVPITLLAMKDVGLDRAVQRIARLRTVRAHQLIALRASWNRNGSFSLHWSPHGEPIAGPKRRVANGVVPSFII